jgi:hypothetical protein
MDVAKPPNGCSETTPPIPVTNTVANQLLEREAKKFRPPTSDEVNDYIIEKDLTATNAEAFINFYESKNWMVGRNKMKSWEAAARGWNGREVKDGNANAAKNFNEWNERPW